MSKTLDYDRNVISVFRSGPTGMSNIRVVRTMTESKIEVALNTLYANINAQNFCILTTVGSYGSFTPQPAPNNIKTE